MITIITRKKNSQFKVPNRVMPKKEKGKIENHVQLQRATSDREQDGVCISCVWATVLSIMCSC